MTNLALIFVAVTAQYHLPPGLLSAVCYVESHHNATATHLDDGNATSLGLCQLHFSTATMLGYTGTVSGLYDPETNAKWAGAYLRHQLNRYNGDTVKALSAYNAGSYRPLRNLDYVRKVLQTWKEHL